MHTLHLDTSVLKTIYKSLVAKKERIVSVYIACKEHNTPCNKEDWWHEYVAKEIEQINEAISVIEQVLHPATLETFKK